MNLCPYCKKLVSLGSRKRARKFCSNYCNIKFNRRIQIKPTKICKECGIKFKKQSHQIFCSRSCKGKYFFKHSTASENLKKGIDHLIPFEKVSNPLPLNPYVRIQKNKKHIYEHRQVMENFLGRELSCEEHVHHINGDPKDNRIENLKILSRSEHQKLHKSKKQN